MQISDYNLELCKHRALNASCKNARLDISWVKNRSYYTLYLYLAAEVITEAYNTINLTEQHCNK